MLFLFAILGSVLVFLSVPPYALAPAMPAGVASPTVANGSTSLGTSPTATRAVQLPSAVVNIYDLYSSPPVPTGLADYGVLNSSGTLIPYEQEASQVTGYALINGMKAYNATPTAGSSPYGAGLQLNVMLQVNTTSGQYVYWLQNTMTFYTNNDTAFFVDNIWNDSSAISGLNPFAISGVGSVYSSEYYATGTSSFSYKTPYAVKLPIAVSRSGSSVQVSFGYQEASGGLPLPAQTTFYDRVTVTEGHPVKDAAIIVSGYHLDPSGHYFDAELVFTGDTNGALTTFTKMDSTLSITYTLTNGLVRPPISTYEFGSNTAEGSYNLETSLVQGKFHVGLGTVDFGKSFVIKASPVIINTPSHLAITAGQSVYDQVALVGGFRAGGSVTYEYFSGGACSGAPVKVGAPVTVTNGVVKNSASAVLGSVGTFSWRAVYSGDSHNQQATSPCVALTVLVSTTSPTHTTISCTKSSFPSGTKVTCTATVTGSYSSRTGTITWSKTSGTGTLSVSSRTCTLVSGKCSATFTGVATGALKIEATYSGDPHNPWSAGTIALTVT